MVASYRSLVGCCRHTEAGDRVPRLITWLLTIALLVVCARTAYFAAYSGFNRHDDEGYVMISTDQFLSGKALYDKVYSQYGPFFYLERWTFHRATQSPVSHESSRLQSWLDWMVAVLLCGWLVHRCTGSHAAAVIGAVAAWRHLYAIAREPGHPQDLCIVLIVGALVVVSFAQEKVQPRLFGLSFAACSALLLTKINLGVYLGLALGITLLFWAGRTRLQQAALAALASVAALLPAILMRKHLHTQEGRDYAIVATLTIGAALLASQRLSGASAPISIRRLLKPAATIVAVILTCAGFVMLMGTSAYGLIEGALLQPFRFASVVFVSPPLSMLSLVSAGCSVLVCLLWLRAPRWPRQATAVLQSMYAVTTIGCIATERVSALVSVGVPWIWLLLAGSPANPARRFARTALCCAASLLTLWSYPVASGQVFFATFLLPVVAAICFWDGVSAFVPRAAIGWRWTNQVAVASILVLCTGMLSRQSREYQALTPLGLWGTEELRVPGRQASAFRQISTYLSQNCDTFVSLPGFNSLYFWTRTAPPTGFNTTAWTALLNAEQQDAIRQRLAKSSRACMVYQEATAQFWLRGQDLAKIPLASDLLHDFHSVRALDGYEIWTRQTRP